MLQGKIRTGELDREITFIKEVTTRGASNQDTITSWTVIDLYPTVFARKTEMKGNEIVIGDQLKYIQKTVFTIRYRTDLSVKNRVVLDDNVYEIISITENGEMRKTFLDVVANFIDNERFFVNSGFSSGFSMAFR
jgi:SPP1 family predicted phage head-tail adaptor